VAPYWIVLPWSLMAAHGSRWPPRQRAGTLREVLWGQYCVFEVFRLQDDVFDGHSQDLVLTYAADQFLVEGWRTFSRQFGRTSPFWDDVLDAVDATSRGVVEVDELQARPDRKLDLLLRTYTRVDSIFRIGALGVCRKLGRSDLSTPVRRLVDELAIAGQILDDLEDVGEDVRRGRHNCVVKLLLSRADVEAAGGDVGRLRQRVFAALVVEDGFRAVLARARHHISRARQLVRPLAAPLMESYIDEGLAALGAIEWALHRHQVRLMMDVVLARRTADS